MRFCAEGMAFSGISDSVLQVMIFMFYYVTKIRFFLQSTKFSGIKMSLERHFFSTFFPPGRRGGKEGRRAGVHGRKAFVRDNRAFVHDNRAGVAGRCPAGKM